MLLETEEVRQYYIKKAEECPLVRGAVAGTKTFTGCLDDIIVGLKEKGPLREFAVFIGTLSALSDEKLDAGDVKRQLWETRFFHSRKFNREARRIFQSLYDASAVLDGDIGRCFILEHFADARPRFVETYRTLSGEEREAVDTRLLNYLAAGGIPGMGEAELDRYLDGLRQQEAGHEGTILRRDLRYHDVHGLCAVEFDMTPEEFQEEKAAHIKAKGLRGRAPSEYMSIELEDLLCGFPDRLRIVKVFGRGKEAEKQGEAYIEELREWHRNRDDEYLRELADIMW